MTIRILIADDHEIVAEGLRFLIQAQPDMEVVACVSGGRDAVRWALDTNPDVVVMDNSMPELNGIEATRQIRERRPDARVIILSMYSDPVHVSRALQASASGYVLKKSAARHLVEAIRSVHAGRRYLSDGLAESVIDQFMCGSPSPDPLDRLSSRERQVLQMLAEGRAVTEIAMTLSLSPKTVETYRARMMEKLGIHDLANLVRFAIQRGVAAIE
jgi:DNA-binding NarL/FixJ family response regulator